MFRYREYAFGHQTQDEKAGRKVETSIRMPLLKLYTIVFCYKISREAESQREKHLKAKIWN